MRSLARVLPLAAALLGACGGAGSASSVPAPPATTPSVAANAPGSSMAFFYQDVAPGGNSVKAGSTADGRTIDTTGVALLGWQPVGRLTTSYGDPVFSRLGNGRWTMTAGTGSEDPRGGAQLMYHEAACPRVDEAAVRVIPSSSSSSCLPARGTMIGKTTEMFSLDGAQYLVSTSELGVRLIKMADGSRTAADITAICHRRTAARAVSELAFGEATVVIDPAVAPTLRLSDTALARRLDGTWVLFVKGYPASAACTPGSLCELCARSIYRTTSADLINWSSLEKVVDQASVPEASTFPDGSVALYWQSFQETCAAQDLNLAARAPIRMAFETSSGALGTPTAINFPKEAFETNRNLHYPTNANPILLPDANALAALNACLAR
jgi:hypothetical protein